MAYPVTLNGRTYTLADFEGTNYVDGLPDAFEDFVTHAGAIYKTTSTTSNTIGTGSKSFTTADNSLPYQEGTPLRISDGAAPATNWMDGIVTAYSGTSLTVNVVSYAGSGTLTDWDINIGGGGTSYTGTLPIAQGGTGATTAGAAATNLGLGTGDSPTFTGVTVTGAFTSQGIDDNADATAITIDSSENVLIGKTSPSTNTVGVEARPDGTFAAVKSSGSTAVFGRNTDDGGIVQFRKDGSTVGSIGTDSGNLNIDGGTNKAGVQFTGSSILPRDDSANADAAITLGGSSNRFQDLYLSGGVYLGGVVGDNLLNDYEIGFFEPSLLGSVSDPTVTWDSIVGQEGWYVKVGRMVHIQINFRTDSVSGGSGNLYVGNLPFASPGLAGQGGMASFAIARAKDWPSNAPCAAYVNEGTDFIILEYRTSANGDNATSQVSDLGTGSNDNLLCISGTYYVS